MADKRMISKNIIGSDRFTDMTFSAQALYIHLTMHADDDGFLNNARQIKRMIGASDNDMELLVSEGYIIMFESGAIVITHWLIGNSVRKDRYTPTRFIEEFKQLAINENNEYVLRDSVATSCQSKDEDTATSYQSMDETSATSCQSMDETSATSCQSMDETSATSFQSKNDNVATQVRLGKVRLGKDRLECVNIDNINNIKGESTEMSHTPHSPDCNLKTTQNFKGRSAPKNNNSQTDEEQQNAKLYSDLVCQYGKDFVDERITRSKSYKNITMTTIADWCREDYANFKTKSKKKNKTINQFNDFGQREYDAAEYEREMLRKSGQLGGGD